MKFATAATWSGHTPPKQSQVADLIKSKFCANLEYWHGPQEKFVEQGFVACAMYTGYRMYEGYAVAGPRFFNHQATAPLLESDSTQAATDALSSAIRTSFDHMKTEDAIAAIQEIWQKVEEITNLAEARMRVLIGRLGTRDAPEKPAWLSALASGLEEPPSEGALLAAERLVSTICQQQPSLQDDLSIESGSEGSIEVRFQGVTWLVRAPRLPWPGVAVRAYFPNESSANPVATSFYYAPTLVNETLEKIGS